MARIGRLEDVMRWLTGNARTRFEATTPNLAVINPLMIENGLIDENTGRKITGIHIGDCGFGGVGVGFAYDEFELYRRGVLTSLNVAILGKVGKRKSSLVKMFINRAFRVGYNALVIDPKHEYDLLFQYLQHQFPGSCKVLEFGTQTKYRLNPLDPLIDEEGQLELISSLLYTAMKRTPANGFNIEERSLLGVAISEAKTEQRGGVATLPRLLNLLHEPNEEMGRRLRAKPSQLKKQSRPMALGLEQLTGGYLSGMFHETTTKGLFQDTPLMAMVCKGLTPDRASVAISVFNNLVFGQAQNANPKDRFHRIFLDEAWDLAAHEHFVTSVRRLSKLGGSYGQAVWFVIHHLENLVRSGGGEGIRDLVPDAGTIIGFQMDQGELRNTATELRYNESDIEQNRYLEPGQSLWKIGNLPTLKVRQQTWKSELPLLRTRHLVEGDDKKEALAQI